MTSATDTVAGAGWLDRVHCEDALAGLARGRHLLLRGGSQQKHGQSDQRACAGKVS